jgi:hypothetical protein
MTRTWINILFHVIQHKNWIVEFNFLQEMLNWGGLGLGSYDMNLNQHPFCRIGTRIKTMELAFC